MTTTATAPVFLSVPDAVAPAPASVEVAPVVWPTATLAEGLVALQGKLPRIHKGETANVKSDKGSYSYSYADLADVSEELLPVLASVGLSFTTRPTLVDGVFLLAYALVHVSGEREEGLYPLPAGGNPQAIGSAITYARRYCLLAMTGAAPHNEDDDARAAMPTRGTDGARGSGAPSEVDTEWVAEARRRVETARSRDDLSAVWAAIRPALVEGRIDQATADRVADAVHARAAQLDAEDAPPVDEAADPPTADAPTADQVRAAQDRAAEGPPAVPMVDHNPAPAPRSVIPPGPAHDDQLAALRARAARIAANHTPGENQ
ncbi:ERF family protein [Nocardiopsis sp. CT-R113]|uniref:ERF family protein n=1 Tax=Nocardiopsis codii TaxID=3065942 RepID=A0ABU7KGB2_9ACTN|nr:ERF family protein [Nocardiopsis sp. CT-R113]MEE2041253.1 ERF family protein [Nocardiopsis sp. CT-R113]